MRKHFSPKNVRKTFAKRDGTKEKPEDDFCAIKSKFEIFFCCRSSSRLLVFVAPLFIVNDMLLLFGFVLAQERHEENKKSRASVVEMCGWFLQLPSLSLRAPRARHISEKLAIYFSALSSFLEVFVLLYNFFIPSLRWLWNINFNLFSLLSSQILSRHRPIPARV